MNRRPKLHEEIPDPLRTQGLASVGAHELEDILHLLLIVALDHVEALLNEVVQSLSVTEPVARLVEGAHHVHAVLLLELALQAAGLHDPLVQVRAGDEV